MALRRLKRSRRIYGNSSEGSIDDSLDKANQSLIEANRLHQEAEKSRAETRKYIFISAALLGGAIIYDYYRKNK